MLWPQTFLINSQGAKAGTLGLHIVAPGLIERAKVVQQCAELGVIRAERLFADRQRAFVKRFRFTVIAPAFVHEREIIERPDNQCIVSARQLLLIFQGAQQELLGFIRISPSSDRRRQDC